MLIVQLVLFKYYPKNKRSRKMIPNLKIDDTITLFEKLNVHGIIRCQGPNASRAKVNDKWVFVSDTYIRQRFIF